MISNGLFAVVLRCVLPESVAVGQQRSSPGLKALVVHAGKGAARTRTRTTYALLMMRLIYIAPKMFACCWQNDGPEGVGLLLHQSNERCT